MFNVGSGEMLVILLLALIVLGPDKLPETARKVGKVVGELRRMSSGFQQEMRQAMDVDGFKQSMNPNPGPTLPPLGANGQAGESSDLSEAGPAVGTQSGPAGQSPPGRPSAVPELKSVPIDKPGTGSPAAGGEQGAA